MPSAHAPPPYLAAVPFHEAPPRRPRRWVRWALVGTAVGIGVAAVLVLLATVPVPRSFDDGFSMNNPGGVSTFTHAVRFSESGSFHFSWATGNGGSVTFSVVGPGSVTLYSSDAAKGSGTLVVNAGATYTFGIYDWLPETVTVSGSLQYSSPMI